jgi:hypothetical protein
MIARALNYAISGRSGWVIVDPSCEGLENPTAIPIMVHGIPTTYRDYTDCAVTFINRRFIVTHQQYITHGRLRLEVEEIDVPPVE